jgi:hypothetical protein
MDHLMRIDMDVDVDDRRQASALRQKNGETDANILQVSKPVFIEAHHHPAARHNHRTPDQIRLAGHHPNRFPA